MARLRLSAGIWIGADPRVGGGHATRAARLCGALGAQGVDARIYADDLDHARRIVAGRADVVSPRAGSFAESCRGDALAVAIVDRPHQLPAPANEMRALRAACDVLVAFDENDREGRFASIHTSVLGHPPSPSRHPCQRLWGPRFAIVDSPCARRTSGATRRKIVVVFGAADPAKQSEQALDALAPLAVDFELTWVLGPLIEAARRREFHKQAARNGVAVIDSPSSLGPALAAADAVVTAFGQTCLEGLAHRVPLLLWHPSAAHAAAATAFLAQLPERCAVDFGCGPSGVATLASWLAIAARERDRFHLFEASRAIDGQGAQRIAQHIAEYWTHLQEASGPRTNKGVRVA